MGKSVVAEVILRNRSGQSSLDPTGAPARDAVRTFRVEDGIAAEVTSKLRDRGIEVVQQGRSSLSIRAELPVFEDVFETHLLERRPPADAAAASSYVATDPVRVPADLSDTVAGVVLPTPATYFA